MSGIDSITTGTVILGVMAMLIFGIGSCSTRQNESSAAIAAANRALRETCITQGGTVIDTSTSSSSNQGFHCIQNGKTH